MEPESSPTAKRFVFPLVALAALVGLCLVFRNPEPRYRGKPLSYWLKDWSQPLRQGIGGNPIVAFQEIVDRRKNGTAAVLQAGTNALPTLIWMLRERDTRFKVFCRQCRVGQWLERRNLLPHSFAPASLDNRTAAQAMSLLGASASAAVPDLIEVMESNSDAESRRAAAGCLGAIGTNAAPAIPALARRSILDEDSLVRMAARGALQTMGMARTNGFREATKWEYSANERIRLAAAMTLEIVDPGRIYGRPTILDPEPTPSAPATGRR